jgi:hypothetical protein
MWGEYQHGSYGSDISAAVEAHVAGVIAASNAMLFHSWRSILVDPHFVSAATVPVETLCAFATPALVSEAVLSKTGCQRTAELTTEIASAHVDARHGGALRGGLPSNEGASRLFAMAVLAMTEGAAVSPKVTYVRSGTDAFFFSDDRRACRDSACEFAGLFGVGLVALPTG